MSEPDPDQVRRFRQLYAGALALGFLGLVVMVMFGWLVPGVILMMSMLALAIGAEMGIRS